MVSNYEALGVALPLCRIAVAKVRLFPLTTKFSHHFFSSFVHFSVLGLLVRLAFPIKGIRGGWGQ